MLSRSQTLLALLPTLLVLTPSLAHAQGHLRWYFNKRVMYDTVATRDTNRKVLGEPGPGLRTITTFTALPETNQFRKKTTITDTRVWVGPSVGFDAFVRESGSGNYRTGIIPGVGYGLKWGRTPKDPKGEPSPWIAIDLFVQGAMSEEDDSHSGFDYFNIDALPVVTILNWISIGYGPRFKTGLDGLPSTHRTLFSFGLRKAT